MIAALRYSRSRQIPLRDIRQGASMSKPKILVFAPREEPPDTIAALEGLGCELVFGNRD
jgi:hypothetical protein